MHLSLYENSQHHVIYSKFDLKIIYSPQYGRTIWDYEQVNTDILQETIYNFDGKILFGGIDSNKSVNISTDIVFNVMKNFILYKTKLIGDRYLPWISKQI